MKISWIETVKVFTIALILFVITDCPKNAFLKNNHPGAINEVFGFANLAINAVSALITALVYTGMFYVL